MRSRRLALIPTDSGDVSRASTCLIGSLPPRPGGRDAREAAAAHPHRLRRREPVLDLCHAYSFARDGRPPYAGGTSSTGGLTTGARPAGHAIAWRAAAAAPRPAARRAPAAPAG